MVRILQALTSLYVKSELFAHRPGSSTLFLFLEGGVAVCRVGAHTEPQDGMAHRLALLCNSKRKIEGLP